MFKWSVLLFVLTGSISFGFAQTVYRSSSRQPKKIMLSDSSMVWMDKNSVLKTAKGFGTSNRKVFLQGDVFFHIKHSSIPFIIHTSHLILSTYEAHMRVDAYASPGEEADVLRGIVNARKSYHSDLDNDHYVLGPSQMVMINRDIDLIEKEKYDTADLKKWLQRFK